MSALSISLDDALRIRAVLDALRDGSRQVGEVRVTDPETGKKVFLGDMAKDLLDHLGELGDAA